MELQGDKYPDYILKDMEPVPDGDVCTYVWKHLRGRNYELIFRKFMGFQSYEKYSLGFTRRFNTIISDYPIDDCMFMDEDEFMEEFFVEMF